MKYLVNVKTKEILKEAKSIGQAWVDTQEDLELIDIKNPVLESIEQDDGSVKTTFRELTNAELSPYLLADINANYQNEISLITSGIPTSEISTWTKQESEARAYKNDNTTPTPLIDVMCETRKCTKEYIVNKIIEKADAYAVAIGRLTGLRQVKEKEILEE